MSSDSPPDLHMLNVVVRDMAASLDFYRRLGIAVPAARYAAGAHVQLKMPGGFSLELDSSESAGLWHAGWRADPASATVVLGFVLPTRQAVDDRYAELTSAGYRGPQPPFDAFWGARYAIVADPDGNDVGLMSPVEESRRTWPPQQSPALADYAAWGAGRTDATVDPAPRPARMRAAGECRVTALAIPDHVCENGRWPGTRKAAGERHWAGRGKPLTAESP